MSNLGDAVIELYHAWLQDRKAAGEEGVFKKSEAWDELRDRIIKLLSAAVNDPDPIRAAPDLNEIARRLFDHADDVLTDEGDRLIRSGADGQEVLPLGRLDALVALGRGDRVTFGDMRAEEYRRADERHWKNLRAVQNAYDEWRRAMQPYQDGWAKGLSVREIESAN